MRDSQVAAHRPAPVDDLEWDRRRIQERRGAGVRGDALLVELTLAADVEEDHVLGEVERRRRGEEAIARLLGATLGQRLARRVLAPAAQALPLVHPRPEPGDAPEHAVQALGVDAAVQKLELRPRGHLPRRSQLQAHAHEAGAQELAAEKMGHEELEPSAFHLHRCSPVRSSSGGASRIERFATPGEAVTPIRMRNAGVVPNAFSFTAAPRGGRHGRALDDGGGRTSRGWAGSALEGRAQRSRRRLRAS